MKTVSTFLWKTLMHKISTGHGNCTDGDESSDECEDDLVVHRTEGGNLNSVNTFLGVDIICATSIAN